MEEKEYVDPYIFVEELSRMTKEGDVFVCDTGNNLAQVLGGYEFKKKQTMFSAFNNTPMGYALPGAVGACFGRDKKPVYCLTGDGGLQMNIQELATVKHYNLPIRVIVFNNQGYGMIQQTQDQWLNSRHEASTCETGVGKPDFVAIAKAYGIQGLRINNNSEIREVLGEVVDCNCSFLIEVMIDPKSRTVPMLKAGRPIEDAEPLLPRAEFEENMIVDPMPISKEPIKEVAKETQYSC